MLKKGSVSQDEYKKLVTKSRRWIFEYLDDLAKQDAEDEACEYPLSEDRKKALFGVISDEFKRKMREEEVFFWHVAEFASKRHLKSEKDAFCHDLMKQMVRSGNIRRSCEKRIEGYRKPNHIS